MRRVVLIGLSALLGVALFALVSTFRSSPFEAIAPMEVALPDARPPAGMALSALPTSIIDARAGFAFRGGAFDEPRAFAQTAVLVRHPRGDLLFDTGVGAEADAQFARTSWLMHTFSKQTVGVPAAKQLRDAGYDFAKLAGIMPTHVHWDHISALAEFPGVPVWLNARERAFVDEGGEITALMRSFGPLPVRSYAFEPVPYLGFAERLDVFGDGAVVLVPAPGHTPGSILAFVALPSGRRFLLLGDLVWQTDGITRREERPWLVRRIVDHDPAEVRVAIARVAGIAARFPALTLLPAHDARAMRALPVFPAQLE
ncbi:MAG: MBL fold metallo-hydrolase [Polyangiales bacterium]